MELYKELKISSKDSDEGTDIISFLNGHKYTDDRLSEAFDHIRYASESHTPDFMQPDTGLFQKQFSDHYENLRNYEKRTGRNLPSLISGARNREEARSLLDELMDVLGGNVWTAAHFLLEQMVLMNRAADYIYINSVDDDSLSSLDNEELVDRLFDATNDYLTTAGYLLDIAYGIKK